MRYAVNPLAGLSLSSGGNLQVMLAVHQLAKGEEKNITAGLIAHETTRSLSHVEQIIKKLRRSGLLVSQRGPNGGYQLAKAPDEIKLLDIITAGKDECIPGDALIMLFGESRLNNLLN